MHKTNIYQNKTSRNLFSKKIVSANITSADTSKTDPQPLSSQAYTPLPDDAMTFVPISIGQYKASGVKPGLRGVPAFASQGTSVHAEGKLFFRGMAIDDFIRTCLAQDAPFETAIAGFYFPKTMDARNSTIHPTAVRFVQQMAQFKPLPSEAYPTLKLLSKEPMRALMVATQIISTQFDSPNTTDPNEALRMGMESMGHFAHTILYLIANSTKNTENFLSEARRQADVGLATGPQGNGGVGTESFARNFLRQLNVALGGNRKYTEADVKLLNLFLITMIDHGAPVSTTAARVTVSSQSDLFSGYAAAIGGLKGPLHGRANRDVAELIENILLHEKEHDNDEFSLNRARSFGKSTSTPKPESLKANPEFRYHILGGLLSKMGGKLPGFGHGKYKTCDPRSVNYFKILETLRSTFTQEESDMLDLYNWLENVGESAINDYRKELHKSPIKTFTNVDFYGAFVLHKLEIPTEFYPLMFFMSRMVGLTLHMAEQWGQPMIRPSSVYVGSSV